MTDAIFDEIRECIEMIEDVERQCDRRGQTDVCLTRDGAHRLVAALNMAADAIAQR